MEWNIGLYICTRKTDEWLIETRVFSSVRKVIWNIEIDSVMGWSFMIGSLQRTKLSKTFWDSFEDFLLCILIYLRFYDEEFDPGSGWTLAAGLTHASRGVTGSACTLLTTGARVSNAYTIYLVLGNSPEKFGLMLYGLFLWHHRDSKGYGTRWVCVLLVSWCGNGTPRLR